MITRIIFLSVAPEKSAEAERIWKQECTPLMVQQTGCLSHQFMRNRENPSEFVSLSSWTSQQAIDKYGASDARKEIQNYTRGALGALHVEIKTYDVLG